LHQNLKQALFTRKEWMISREEIREIAKRLGLRPLVRLIRHPARTIRGRVVFGRWDVTIHGDDFQVMAPKNVRVGADLSINHGVFILGRNGIVIGDRVTLAARCMLMDGGPVGQGNSKVPVAGKDAIIEIGNDVLIGAGAIVLPGVRIGAGSIVGAGSVVMGNVQPGITVLGNPARSVWPKPPAQLPEPLPNVPMAADDCRKHDRTLLEKKRKLAGEDPMVPDRLHLDTSLQAPKSNGPL
jgi:maltose O-acetyltransferase